MLYRLGRYTSAGLFMLVTACTSALADEADEVVGRHMQRLSIPGVSLAVIKGSEVLKKAAYGVASVELGVPATTETVYVLASMTKCHRRCNSDP